MLTILLVALVALAAASTFILALILNVLKNIRDLLWTKWMPGPKGY